NPESIRTAGGIEKAGLASRVGSTTRRIGNATEGQSVLLVSGRKNSIRNEGVQEHRRLAYPLRLRRLQGVFVSKRGRRARPCAVADAEDQWGQRAVAHLSKAPERFDSFLG